LICVALGNTLDENANDFIIGGHPMWQQEFIWFFTLFHHEFRTNNPIAFEVLMVLAVAHLFGFYNPKQLADFLEVPHQNFYTELKNWSIYHVKKMLLRFMVKQAAEQLKPVMSKSAATRSRAGMTLSIDNSVMDRFGKLLRCTWSWYSGRYHKVIRGQDLLGIVLTIQHIALPLHLLFCPKQGRYHTTKADVLIFMLTQLKTAFLREGIDISQLPLTMDSAYVSQELRQRLHQLGFIDIIIAGKGNYVFTIDTQKWDASTWKKVLMLEEPKWGIDVPSCRLWGSSPTFGSLILFFFRKSTTRSYYLMNFSQRSLRGAEIWHIWKQHHVIECFWKIMKSIFQLRSMHLQGDGLYTALLIKVFAYLLALRLQAQGVFSKLTLTEIMRQLRREADLRDFLATHFHAPFSIG
jgi:Transposase DDE domain